MKRTLIICLVLLIVAIGCTPGMDQPPPAQTNENLQPTTTPHESDPPEQLDPLLSTESEKWSIAARELFVDKLLASGASEEDVVQIQSILQDYFSIHAAVLVGGTPEITDQVPYEITEPALKFACTEYEQFRSHGVYIVGCQIEYGFESFKIDLSTGKYTLCVREYVYEIYNRSGNISDPTDTMGTAMSHEFTFMKTDSESMCLIGQSDDWIYNGS